MPHYDILYARRPTFRPSGQGPVPPLRVSHIAYTHTRVITIHRPNIAAAIRYMQGENWSPNGEAKPLIKSLGLRHTSMSTGDVIRCPNDTYWELTYAGWTQIPDDTKGDTA